MRFVHALVVVLIYTLTVAPASAEETPSPSLRPDSTAIQLATAVPPAELVAAPRPQRPAALVPLYISFGVLQGLDVHSTSRALENGAVEANPLMKGVADSAVGLAAVKAAAGAGVIFASERMWKRNRVAAVLFMTATNSAMAWVVQHNHRVAR
ncbi:MAG TPA: DUF5658 family protein [Vicinamibacterales bacterium]|jgi:hypothetical protein|nr:DUF5658 family protein [Vicinamibacterales bacterium]